LFKNILQPTSCLHYLVPQPCDAELLSHLKSSLKISQNPESDKEIPIIHVLCIISLPIVLFRFIM